MALSLFKGHGAEQQAKQYLTEQKLSFVCRNYRCRRGEIDLIMRDGETLVFVEVRFRKKGDFGSAAESITAAKIKKLTIAAQTYLAEQKLADTQACRFDVVAIEGTTINWIKNAF